MPVSVHTIAFKGYAGFGFILLMLASIFYVLGFGSVSWTKYDSVFGVYPTYGLWESCSCSTRNNELDGVLATQILIALGLVGLIVAVVLTTLYMCVHRISKNATIIALIITCFVATALMLVGVIIYGVTYDTGLDWGFAMTIIGMCFTCAAGVVSVIQMRKSGVPCCGN